MFSAPNYCGEFDNSGAMMTVDETLMCSFQILKPVEKKQKFSYGGLSSGRPVTPPRNKVTISTLLCLLILVHVTGIAQTTKIFVHISLMILEESTLQLSNLSFKFVLFLRYTLNLNN